MMTIATINKLQLSIQARYQAIWKQQSITQQRAEHCTTHLISWMHTNQTQKGDT